MPRVGRLSGGRLLRPDRDHVGGVLLRKQTDVRRAGELDGYRFLAVVAEPIPDPGGEPLVGDADVLADPKARNARECAGRGLEDEAHGPPRAAGSAGSSRRGARPALPCRRGSCPGRTPGAPRRTREAWRDHARVHVRPRGWTWSPSRRPFRQGPFLTFPRAAALRARPPDAARACPQGSWPMRKCPTR